MFTLAEIEEEVRQLARKIDAPEGSLPTFGRSADFARPHIEIRDDRYHFVIEERGEELKRESTNDFRELLYWIFAEVTFDMATGYEAEHRRPRVDFRRLMFETQIGLLKRLDPSWAQRRQTDIDRILVQHPFRDLKNA
ncbi:MAG TPA: Imm63 family immunity protein [Lacunisphaera sp.]|nr:Imm63 family immunity protein [Lacunisphaera sp.]